jgi:hypothetical protein
MYHDFDLLRERLINTGDAQLISLSECVRFEWKTWKAEAEDYRRAIQQFLATHGRTTTIVSIAKEVMLGRRSHR